MTGYAGQEPIFPRESSSIPPERVLTFEEATQLNTCAEANPEGPMAIFLLTAAAQGWKVDIPNDGETSMPRDVVKTIWVNLNSGNLACRAYANLVAQAFQERRQINVL